MQIERFTKKLLPVFFCQPALCAGTTMSHFPFPGRCCAGSWFEPDLRALPVLRGVPIHNSYMHQARTRLWTVRSIYRHLYKHDHPNSRSARANSLCMSFSGRHFLIHVGDSRAPHVVISAHLFVRVAEFTESTSGGAFLISR